MSAPPLEAALAAGFGQQVERWARERGADAVCAHAAGVAAAELSRAVSAGHVCLGLAQLPALPGVASDGASWRATLRASGMVAEWPAPGTDRPHVVLPLVLDEGDRLYLLRYFDYEQRLARRLARAASAPFDLGASLERLRPTLDALFDPGEGAAPADPQKLAAALALRNRLTVISGGPGTGKTTTVVRLLACLLEADPGCRIALAAPTGKAAARMIEAIRQRAATLPEALRARLPTQASTVHRLLGARPGGGVAHHAGHPLAIDALVVDEASMLDLALATRLLEAVPEAARIVLLGDKDQLAAVESGAVFAEIGADPRLSTDCVAELAALTGSSAEAIAQAVPASASAGPQPDAPALPDATIWLTRNYRFEAGSGIGTLAALVNAGRAAEALQCLRDASRTGDAPLRWIDDAEAGAARAIATAQDVYAAYRDAVQRAGSADAAAVAAALERVRVLCALREGALGVRAVNAALEAWFRAALGERDADARSPWYPGRPVQVLRNDALLRLFNGDIGIALPDADGAMLIHFADAAGGFRAVAPARLPPHETAFATTVHKAQGSEFAEVLVLLPAAGSRVLTRELLYTALTRARERVTLVAPAAALTQAIATPTRRHSGLLARLR